MTLYKIPNDLRATIPKGQVAFNPSKVNAFKPFKHGRAIFGGHFGDEGKGKCVDITAREWKSEGLHVLSIRGQGSGNAGHTVKIGNNEYHFHYLTSAGFSADIMLLMAGMLIDPIRVLNEMKVLPAEMQKSILIDERAMVITDLNRFVDAYREERRHKTGTPIIGTTKSGVGPGVSLRGHRDHVTFADAKACQSEDELAQLFAKDIEVPEEDFKRIMNPEYLHQIYEAINKLQIVDGLSIISKCRYDTQHEWAVLLEVSQAVGLDHLFGNNGHFVTSTHCTNTGAAANSALTKLDFPDGDIMVLKAYASKVGSGPFTTKFTSADADIANYIYKTVGECGVTTGRVRDLGYFDAVAVRHAIAITGVEHICINCMDVVGQVPAKSMKICYAYYRKGTDPSDEANVTYEWPYFLKDWAPLYMEVPVGWDCYKLKDISKLDERAWNYILTIERLIAHPITWIGTGGSSEDILKLPQHDF